MRFCSLGSGSGGNATLIEASQGITSTQVLVDCGFSLRELTRRLMRAGSAPADLSAVFITHEHGDHAGCALNLARQHRVPIVTSRGTWRAMCEKQGEPDIDPALIRFARDGEAITLGDIELQPFAVPHDANEPLQLRASDGRHCFGMITDVGSITPYVVASLQHCHALLLECNHDEALLRASSYPNGLKRRILGSHGHLSNDSASQLLRQLLHPGLQQVIAAHLSARNNTAELAAVAIAGILGAAPEDIAVADQALGLEWVNL
ncbi:MBL fold metallo-hydrolase [soil metagenome]